MTSEHATELNGLFLNMKDCLLKMAILTRTQQSLFTTLFSLRSLKWLLATLESGIDVGQGINVGPGKFVKKNKCRALNKRRA